MKTKIFLAKVINGQLNYGSDFNLARLTDALKNTEGKTWRLEYVETKRTLNQNAYYFLYLGVISQETGDDVMSLHEFFKRTFLPPKFITVMGKTIKIPSSTTDLKKYEFGEYLDRIAGMIDVPLPDIKLAGFYSEN